MFRDPKDVCTSAVAQRRSASKRVFFQVAVAAVLVVVLSGASQASPISGSPTNIVGTNAVTFDEHVFADRTPLTNQYQDTGLTFVGIKYNPVGPNPGTPNYDGNGIGDFGANEPAINPHFINFVNPTTGAPVTVTAAAFSLASQNSTTTFTSYLAGAPVETFNASTSLFDPNNFYGFSNSLFDSISVTVRSFDNADLIDNVHFSLAVTPTPEPATLALFAVGGVGLGFMRSRKARR